MAKVYSIETVWPIEVTKKNHILGIIINLFQVF